MIGVVGNREAGVPCSSQPAQVTYSEMSLTHSGYLAAAFHPPGSDHGGQTHPPPEGMHKVNPEAGCVGWVPFNCWPHRTTAHTAAV